jgi:hypothetical protein
VRVDGSGVELAGNEKEHGAHGGKATVALNRLEEAIESLDEAIDLTGLGPGEDAVESVCG